MLNEFANVSLLQFTPLSILTSYGFNNINVKVQLFNKKNNHIFNIYENNNKL